MTSPAGLTWGPGPQAWELRGRGFPRAQPWALHWPHGLSELHSDPENAETLLPDVEVRSSLGWRSVTSGERRSRPALADSGPDRLWKVSLIHTHPRPLPFEGSCSARLPCPPLWAPESWPVPETGALTSQAHSRFPERGTGRRQASEGQDWHSLCAAPICLPAREALSSPPPNSATAWVCSRLFGSVSVTCLRQSVLLDGLLLESRDLSFRCQLWTDDRVSGGPGPAGCGALPRWCRGPPSRGPEASRGSAAGAHSALPPRAWLGGSVSGVFFESTEGIPAAGLCLFSLRSKAWGAALGAVLDHGGT